MVQSVTAAFVLAGVVCLLAGRQMVAGDVDVPMDRSLAAHAFLAGNATCGSPKQDLKCYR